MGLACRPTWSMSLHSPRVQAWRPTSVPGVCPSLASWLALDTKLQFCFSSICCLGGRIWPTAADDPNLPAHGKQEAEQFGGAGFREGGGGGWSSSISWCR